MNTAVIFEVEKFATHDGPGIRTVVFMKGCPMRCMWCHSPESWSPAIQTFSNGEVCGVVRTADDVLEEVLQDKDFYDTSGGGLTLSGGEALFNPAFAVELLSKAKKAGVRTAIETSGYAQRKVIDAALPFVDLWLYDIKEINLKKHRQYTGKSNELILDNLRHIDSVLAAEKNSGRSITLRCPMIPGINDGEEELSGIGKLADELASVSFIDVEPYIPYGIDKARRLGLKVYEAPQPPQEYGPKIAEALTKHTHKTVRLP